MTTRDLKRIMRFSPASKVLINGIEAYTVEFQVNEQGQWFMNITTKSNEDAVMGGKVDERSESTSR